MTSALPLMTTTFADQQQSAAAAATEAVAVRRRVTASAASSKPASETGRKAVEDVVSAAVISKHCTATDAWVVVDGVVYDISKFLATHPGGAQVIVESLQAGENTGEVMRGDDSSDSHHAHSQYAFRMLQQFRIGRVRDDDDSSNQGGLQFSSASKERKFTVDLNKPLVFQVGNLGADYDQWVHDPVVQKEPPRFFESDIAEFFTKTAWWVIPAVWGPLVVYLAMAALKDGLWPSVVLLDMAAGAFIWTFIEYLLHRFVFHMKTSNYWTNMTHYFLHGFHHKHPMDGTRLVFPPAITGIIITMIWYITEPLCLIVGRPTKVSLFSGGVLMYIIYDLTHYFLHFGTPFSKMSSKLKRFHLNHHFRDQTNSYGVTTPFWDTIFDTFPGNPIKH